jgi:hypothetical protein
VCKDRRTVEQPPRRLHDPSSVSRRFVGQTCDDGQIVGDQSTPFVRRGKFLDPPEFAPGWSSSAVVGSSAIKGQEWCSNAMAIATRAHTAGELVRMGHQPFVRARYADHARRIARPRARLSVQTLV